MKKFQFILFIFSIVAISTFGQAPPSTNVYTNYTGAWSSTALNLPNQGPNNITLTGDITSTTTISATGTAVGTGYGVSSPEYKYIVVPNGNSTTTVTISFSSPVRDLVIPTAFVYFGTSGSYIQGSYKTPGNVVRDLTPSLHSSNSGFAIHTISNNRFTYDYNDSSVSPNAAVLYEDGLIWTADGDVSEITLIYQNNGSNANGSSPSIRIFPMSWIPISGGTLPSANPDLDAQLCEGINVAFVLDRSGSMDANEIDSVRQGVIVGLTELEQATVVNNAMFIHFGNTPVVGLGMTPITTANFSSGGVIHNYLYNDYVGDNQSTNWKDALVEVTNQVNNGVLIDMVVLVSDGYPNKNDGTSDQGIVSYYLDDIIPYANTLKNLGVHLTIFGTGGLTQNSGQEISSYVTDQTDPLAYTIGSDVREVDYAIANNFSDFPPLFFNFFNDCVTQANFPPVAVDDYYTTPLNTTLTVTVPNGITPNDSDPDGDPTTVTVPQLNGPNNGSITLAPDGSFVYTPNTGFFGIDTIEYQTCDPGGLCDEAFIYITVEKTELQLIKTATYNDANGNMCLDVGEVVTYTFTINNIGNVAVDQISLEDPIIGITEYACGSGSLGGNKTRVCTATYTVLPADLAAGGIINSATVNGIDANSNPVSDVSSNSTSTPSTPTEISTCECTRPALTLGPISCDGSTFTVDFFTDETITNVSHGSVSGGSIINVPFGVTLNVTASSSILGCDITQSVIIPASCPTNCVYPDLSIGQPICTGTTYGLIFNESTGATVSASAGTVSGNTIVNIPLNTNVTVSASNGACVSSFVVNAPSNCDDPCDNPLVSVSNATCTAGGAATYTVNFIATTGASVSASHGTVSGNSVINIPSGQNVTVTATLAGCDNTVLIVPAATCPDCIAPALTVGNLRCNTSGFSVDFITDGTVSSNVGTVSGNSIIDIPFSSSLVVTATSTPGCTTSQTLNIPASCPNNCVFPDLSVGQPICDGTTYSVIFNESTGATVTASAGTVNGSTITGIPINTDVTVSASNGACVTSIIVAAPTNCDDPCSNPLVGVSNAVCDAGGSATYFVNFVARSGATVSVSHGTISGNSIINIPSGQDLTVTASFDGCESTVLVVPAAICPECIAPALTIGNISCSATGYNMFFISDGTVTTNLGTISGTTIFNVPFGSTLVVTATSTAGCTTTQSAIIPATCPTNCVFPDLSVGQPICDGTTYSLVFNESTGATVTASAGTVSGFTITGIPINSDVTVSAANGACIASFIVSAPTNCDDPCANPLVGVSNAVCDPGGAATYFVNFVARTGAVVSVSHGTISGNSIINIPSGQDLTVTASFDGCESTVLVVPASVCPDCIFPALTVGNLMCTSSGFSVDFISNATVTSNVGTISGNSIINIPFSSTLTVTSTKGPGCTTNQSLNIPSSCPTNCFFPELSVGQPICTGTTYSVVFNETTGATINTTAGTVNGNVVSGIPIGTDIVLSATNGSCVASFNITSPTSCDDPCANPLVAVTNGNCTDDASETYEVQFVLTPGATLSVSAGTIDLVNGLIFDIPSGVDLTVTASFSGCENTVLVVPAATCECPIVATVDVVDPSDCELNNGSITINGTGTNLSYSIDGGISFNDDNTFYALAAGAYDIIIRTSDGGCELNWGTEVLSNASSPIVINNIFPTNPSTCASNDGQIAIGATGVGNVEYSIDGGLNFQSTGLFQGLDIGIYNFIVRNVDGTCPIEAGPIQLTNPASPEIDFVNVINSLECGVNDGIITINATGGTPPYQYTIDGGASWSNSNTFFELAEGNYDIGVRNADQSCELLGQSTDLIAKSRPLYAGAIKGNTTCLDDGTLLIAAAGGQTPGAYQVSLDNGLTWVNSASNGITTFTDLAAGTYSPIGRNLDMSCQLAFPDISLLSICADLRLDKSANVAIANHGDDVIFAITLCNDGPAAATGVFVDDLLPSGYSYQSYTSTSGSYNSFTGIWNVTQFGGSLASGSCDTLWVTGNVNASGNYNNIAQVAASDIDDPDSEPNNGVPSEDDQDNVDLPINTVPVAVDDATTTNEDFPVTFDVTDNDDFGDNGPSTGEISIVSGPSNGTANIDDNGSSNDPTDDLIVYNPDANFHGKDTVVYQICDIDGDCDTAIHVITIISVDEVPEAIDDSAITLEDVPVTIDVTDDDSFGGDGPSTTDIAIPDGTNGLQQPANGTVTLVNGGDNDPTNDEILYTPNPGYSGTDQFAYQICDIDNDCDIAIVDITITNVDELPVAVDDDVTTAEDTDVTIDVTGNDSFGGDGPSTTDITLPDGSNGLIQPANGTITLVNGGDNDPTNDEVLYSPDANFHGSDQFEYIICDIDGDCDTALVDITITSVNEVPVAVDDASVTDEDTPITIDVTEDDNFMGDGPSSSDINIPDGVNGLQQPANGTVTLVNGGDGDPTNDEILYTPNPNFAGVDQFEYEICDADNDCDVAVVDITVTPFNDPPIAVNDVSMTDEGIPVVIEVLDNDSDIDGTLVVTTIDVIVDPTNGTTTINPDGTVTYDPDPSFHGIDSFTYVVCDDGNPNPVLCDTAVAYITITQICTDFNLSVYLEGPYLGGAAMRTDLNNYRLLPGQDLNLSSNPIAPFVGEATAIGQPYHVAPWNHNGTEGDRYGDPATNNHPDQIAYDTDVVDWVLVSVRQGDSSATNFWRCAGLLKSDGTVEIPEECDCLVTTPGTKYYVVIEHRNHLPVMSEVIYDENQTLNFDFRINDSWVYEIFPGFELGVGQKQIATGVYAMYGANGDQNPGNFDRRDVNSGDNTVWFLQTGTIFKYRDGDFDLNADINSGDDTMWFINAGTTFTQMPLNSND